MMASRHPCPLTLPNQEELDALSAAGVPPMALIRPEPIMIARGTRAEDRLFDADDHGDRWIAFEVSEADDLVFWNRTSNELASWSGRAFALGQHRIGNAATYCLDRALNIFVSPLDWLRSGRQGIVILPGKWPLAFDRLRDAPRIALARELLPAYRRHMQPARMPRLLVLTERQVA